MTKKNSGEPRSRKIMIGYDYMGTRIKYHTVYKYVGNGYWDLLCRKCKKHIIVFYKDIWQVPCCECRIEEENDRVYEIFITAIYNMYSSGAKNRNLPFKLSREHFENLILSKCFYCGKNSSNNYKHSSGKIFSYNGIDRINSNLGYHLFNCVPCCHNCNMMKMAMSVREFLESVENIHYYQNTPENGDFCI